MTVEKIKSKLVGRILVYQHTGYEIQQGTIEDAYLEGSMIVIKTMEYGETCLPYLGAEELCKNWEFQDYAIWEEKL